MHSIGSPLLWAAFITFVVVMLVLDLGVLHRKAHAPSTKESAVWTGVWIAIAVVFDAHISTASCR